MATYIGAFTCPGTSAEINLVLEVNLVSQSITANTSTLSWNFYAQEHVNANPWRATANSSATAVVGNTVFSSGSLAYDFRAPNTTQPIGSGTTTVTHNADGTKSISIAASYRDGGSIIGNADIGTTLTLPTIPRNRMRVGVAGTWKACEVFVGVNGVWRMAQPHAGVSDAWRLNNSN